MFEDSLEEFDDSFNVVENLIEEYKNSEKSDFIDWNMEDMEEMEEEKEDDDN